MALKHAQTAVSHSNTERGPCPAAPGSAFEADVGVGGLFAGGSLAGLGERAAAAAGLRRGVEDRGGIGDLFEAFFSFPLRPADGQETCSKHCQGALAGLRVGWNLLGATACCSPARAPRVGKAMWRVAGDVHCTPAREKRCAEGRACLTPTARSLAAKCTNRNISPDEARTWPLHERWGVSRGCVVCDGTAEAGEGGSGLNELKTWRNCTSWLCPNLNSI
jgi:hypothetical protein